MATVALPLSFFTSIAKTDPASLREGWIFPLVAVAVIGASLATATLYIGTYLLVNSPALWSPGNWLVAGRGHYGAADHDRSRRHHRRPLLRARFPARPPQPPGLFAGADGVVFLMLMLPPATNLSVMASRAGRNEEAVSFSLLVTYLLYLVALPLWLFVFLRLSGG